MVTVITDSVIAKTVREVDELLEILQGELDSAKNPHRAALRSLGVDSYGWTSSGAYSDEAFRIWDEHLRRNPHDLETIHHLAIMHHARAIDLESTSKPRGADADWKNALDYWTRLWEQDQFWEGIVAIACKGTKPDAVHALRQSLPQRLLRIHFDIAFDDSTRKERLHRSAYHMELAQGAAFPREHLEAVQREVYAECSRAVPDAAWRSHELDPKVIEEGARVILGFLDLAPDCLPALEDAVRLQVRRLNAWYTDFQAAGVENESQRRKLLSQFQSTSKQWRPHFDRLAKRNAEADESARTGLCHWYRIMAEIHRALELSEEAEKLYELGMEAGNLEDEEVGRCSRGLGETRAISAREKAAAGATDARARCDKARDTDGLSPLGHLVLAQAYLHINEFGQAKGVCEKGLKRQPDGIDLDDFEDYQDTQQRIKELLDIIDQQRRAHEAQVHIDEAQEYIKDQQFGKAISALDQALTVNPESALAMFLRCQCCFAEDRIEEARRDLENFLRRAEAEGSQEGINVAKVFEKEQLRPVEEMINKFGRNGMIYHKQAVQCFKNDQFEKAAQLLRQAAACTKPAGRNEINKELAIVLNAWAGKDVSDTMNHEGRSPEEHLPILQNALERLIEATQFDGSNKNAKENLEVVRTLVEQLQNAKRQREQILKDYGNEHAFELRQQAVQAWNLGHHDQALKLLRSALSESKQAMGQSHGAANEWERMRLLLSPRLAHGPVGANKIAEELSDLLTQEAVRCVNQLQGLHGQLDLYQVLDTAEALLDEAKELNPLNTNATQGQVAIAMIKSQISRR